MPVTNIPYSPVGQEASNYLAIAASQTTKPVGVVSTGSVGDYIEQVTVIGASSVAGAVTIFDGTTAVFTIPAAAGQGVNPPYPVWIQARAQARWNITTGAAVSVVVVGSFK